MGIFDRFRKAAPTDAPAPAPPPPALPARATVESYVIADAVGVLACANGARVRFGRSACRGFEPVVGAAVVIEAAADSPRGWRASAVTLDPGDAGYDARIAARDQAHGLAPRALGADQAAATARQLGVITVLLEEPLPEGTQALRAWAAAAGFPRDGIEVDTARELGFTIAGRAVLTYPGRAPFPAGGLDTRGVPADFDRGRSFLGLGTGLPGGDRQLRAIRGAHAPDPWGVAGSARQVGRLVRALAGRATGVVLHRAGDLVVAVDDFVARLGDLDDPACRPFAAWLDVGVIARGAAHVYATRGMDAFGLPDVAAPVVATDRWSRARRHEAVLLACHAMIRDNRELTAADTLRVPLGARVGARPLDRDDDRDDDGAAITYAIAPDHDGAALALTPIAELDAGVRWRDDGAAVPLDLYQALFACGLADAVPGELVHEVAAVGPDAPPHAVQVRARHDGRGAWIVTSGLGRVADAGGGHLELAAWTAAGADLLLELVGQLAAAAHASPHGWKPADTLAAPIPELGIGGFVLADGGAIAMGAGAAVRVLLLVPLSATDYDRVRGGGAAAWLAAHPIDERAWAPFVARA